jgi:CubicO group peptidase (beta-lactamase class C family)
LSQGVVLLEIKPVHLTSFTQTVVVDDCVYSATHEFHLRFEAFADGKILEIGGGPSEMQSIAMSQDDCLAQIQHLCDRGARAGVCSGTVLIARGSDVLFEYACGAANKRYDASNNPDTRFNLGSANKMFTAVALAQLVGGPAGGGYSTVRDLHRFANALISGNLVGPEMRQALWTDYTGVGDGYGFEKAAR